MIRTLANFNCNGIRHKRVSTPDVNQLRNKVVAVTSRYGGCTYG